MATPTTPTQALPDIRHRQGRRNRRRRIRPRALLASRERFKLRGRPVVYAVGWRFAIPSADDARELVAEAHYTGCRVRQESEILELWLFNAPSHVLRKLEAIRPGVYLIHNDAPRPRTVVDDLRDSFDWAAMKSDGIEATSVGPSEDGYLLVGVMSDVPTAQAKLDAIYGAEVARVFYRERAIALPYHGAMA
jgi:hypothetical protein